MPRSWHRRSGALKPGDSYLAQDFGPISRDAEEPPARRTTTRSLRLSYALAVARLARSGAHGNYGPTKSTVGCLGPRLRTWVMGPPGVKMGTRPRGKPRWLVALRRQLPPLSRALAGLCSDVPPCAIPAWKSAKSRGREGVSGRARCLAHTIGRVKRPRKTPIVMFAHSILGSGRRMGMGHGRRLRR